MNRFITYRRRVALTGLYNSGKTVFLTSMLEHLRNLSGDFDFTGGGKLDYFQHIPAKGYDEFPLEACRSSIVRDHEFPAKSKVPSRYRCYIKHSNKRQSYLLDVFDFPGERFADAFMVGKSYDQWSDAILDAWTGEWYAGGSEFMAACEETNERKFLDEFRRFLAGRVLACQPHISPSSFKLSIDGEAWLKRKPSVDGLLGCGTFAGLDAQNEFAPLPVAVRKKHASLAAKMRDGFDKYRKQVVEPLFGTLSGCDRLIVLLDIPFLLAAGPDALNDCNKLLGSIMAGSRHNGNWLTDVPAWLTNLVLPAGWRFGGVTKIAFVATKSDLVARSDQDRLLGLLDQMIAPLRSSLQGIDYKCFTASAIASTDPAAEPDSEIGGYLTGRLKYDTSGTNITKRSPNLPAGRFKVSRLPAKWPTRWSPGKYEFPEVYPEMPEAQFMCPTQNNLARVLEFILSK